MITPGTGTVILAGGRMDTTPTVSEADLVIAADSGYDHAMERSISVDILIGDLDSISPAGLQHADSDTCSVSPCLRPNPVWRPPTSRGTPQRGSSAPPHGITALRFRRRSGNSSRSSPSEMHTVSRRRG